MKGLILAGIVRCIATVCLHARRAHEDYPQAVITAKDPVWEETSPTIKRSSHSCAAKWYEGGTDLLAHPPHCLHNPRHLKLALNA